MQWSVHTNVSELIVQNNRFFFTEFREDLFFFFYTFLRFQFIEWFFFAKSGTNTIFTPKNKEKCVQLNLWSSWSPYLPELKFRVFFQFWSNNCNQLCITLNLHKTKWYNGRNHSILIFLIHVLIVSSCLNFIISSKNGCIVGQIVDYRIQCLFSFSNSRIHFCSFFFHQTVFSEFDLFLTIY